MVEGHDAATAPRCDHRWNRGPLGSAVRDGLGVGVLVAQSRAIARLLVEPCFHDDGDLRAVDGRVRTRPEHDQGPLFALGPVELRVADRQRTPVIGSEGQTRVVVRVLLPCHLRPPRGSPGTGGIAYPRSSPGGVRKDVAVLVIIHGPHLVAPAIGVGSRFATPEDRGSVLNFRQRWMIDVQYWDVLLVSAVLLIIKAHRLKLCPSRFLPKAT